MLTWQKIFERDFEISSTFIRDIVLEVHKSEIIAKKSGHPQQTIRIRESTS
jgi:hypothetical protein